MKQEKQRQYAESDLESMSPLSIYLLMEAEGADVFGLWPADKSDILRSYGQQIGFKQT